MGGSTAGEKTQAHRELPDPKALAEAGEIMIKDKDNKEIPLKSLWTDKPADEKQLIIFIRHFFCGSCEQYIRALATALPPSTLSTVNTTITIIGCGQTVCIPSYAERTSCPYPIYADPSVQIYKKLNMVSNLKLSQTPEYITKSFFRNVIDSTWNALSTGLALKAGPGSQNGGEWLFQGGELKWVHRMRNPHDHTETRELKEVLGIKE